MTQEEINNLKIGDCFTHNSSIYKVVKKGNTSLRVLYIGVYDYAIIKDEVGICCNSNIVLGGCLCDEKIYNKALKLIGMCESSIKSIMASSSAIAKKED